MDVSRLPQMGQASNSLPGPFWLSAPNRVLTTWSMGTRLRKKISLKYGVSFGFARGFLSASSLIQALGFMHSPTGAVDADNDRIIHHAVHDGGRDHGIAQVPASEK